MPNRQSPWAACFANSPCGLRQRSPFLRPRRLAIGATEGTPDVPFWWGRSPGRAQRHRDHPSKLERNVRPARPQSLCRAESSERPAEKAVSLSEPAGRVGESACRAFGQRGQPEGPRKAGCVSLPTFLRAKKVGRPSGRNLKRNRTGWRLQLATNMQDEAMRASSTKLTPDPTTPPVHCPSGR